MRESGYYWVKEFDNFLIYYFDKDLDCWLKNKGEEYPKIYDAWFLEINEERIKTPEDK